MWMLVNTNEEWYIGRGDVDMLETDELIKLADVWHVIHKVHLTQSASGQIGVQTLAPILVPIVGATGSIADAVFAPSIVFCPENQDEWQRRIDNAEQIAFESRSGVKIAAATDMPT